MNVAPKIAIPEADIRADPVEVFGLRCNARARLYATGEIDLQTAVDELQQSAELNGLVAKIGQDAVQAIMSKAFGAVRAPTPTSTRINMPNDEYESLPSSFASACRKADEKQRRKPRDPRIDKLRQLMDDDVSLEHAYAKLNKRAPGDVPEVTLKAAEFLTELGDLERWRNWLAKYSEPERTAILKHLEQRARAHDSNTR